MKFDIKNNDQLIINISDDDMNKINDVIYMGKLKFTKKIENLINEDIKSIEKYDFYANKKIIIKHRKLISDVIKFVIENYDDELKELEVVFLACSFGRQTNKIESDLDLHFIYKTNDYSYKYEEIVCYIITQILGKNRDDIDPKLIINFDQKLKKECELNMTNNDLYIVLKSHYEKIVYKYLSNKKKKFFLQYNNSKLIDDLEKYILHNGIVKNNLPWAHSYYIIYGKKIFENMYSNIYNIEKKLLTDNYYKNQIKELISELNSINLNILERNISIIKKDYQSRVFTTFYKCLNIIRLYYVKEGYDIKFLKIYDLYNKVDVKFKKIIDHILIYIWEVKKLAIYCNQNNICYSIHINNSITYRDLTKINKMFIFVRSEILNVLKELEEKNGK